MQSFYLITSTTISLSRDVSLVCTSRIMNKLWRCTRFRQEVDTLFTLFFSSPPKSGLQTSNLLATGVCDKHYTDRATYLSRSRSMELD